MSSDAPRSTSPPGAIRRGLRAGLVAGIVSGAPSTAYSIATRRDPWEATVAAGSILVPNENRRPQLIGAAIPVHFTLSAFWGVVLGLVMPRGRPVVTGAVAGLALGALDLGIVGRRFPRIRALPAAPQFADHIAFGITVAAILERSSD